MELETFTMAYLFKKKTWKDTDFLSTVIGETKKKNVLYVFDYGFKWRSIQLLKTTQPGAFENKKFEGKVKPEDRIKLLNSHSTLFVEWPYMDLTWSF